jgi:hypothetical protein
MNHGPNGKMVTVRIAVAVADDCGWSAVGSCLYEADGEAADAAVEYLPLETSDSRQIYVVTADLPVPCKGRDSRR